MLNIIPMLLCFNKSPVVQLRQARELKKVMADIFENCPLERADI